MRKVVEKVFIGKDISRTADLSGWPNSASNNLAEGEILVLDKNKEILTAGSTVADSDTIYIVEGTGSTYDYVTETGTSVTGVRKVLYSDPIVAANVTEWSGKSYAAATEAVWSIDLTGWTPVVGTEYVIRVLYKDINEDPRQFTQTYRYIAETATLDTEGAAIASLINQDSRRRVNATYTAGTDVLALTGRAYDDNSELDSINEYKQVNIEVFLFSDNFDTYTSSALTTTPSPGFGSWKLVRDQEKWSQGYEGATNRIKFPTAIPSFRTVKDETYDTLIIRHKNAYVAADNADRQVDITTKVFIPNPAAANQSDDVLAVLNPWMASTPKAFANVSV